MHEDAPVAAIIDLVRRAFASTPRPADAFLVGSRDGCEPEESVAPFYGREWSSLEPAMLNANCTALSFFSEGGLRYFMPAFLVADLRRQLDTADPLFHLTHGLWGADQVVHAGGRAWTRRQGRNALLNPRRYGTISWQDHARFRLAVFCREEADAIVEYLRWRAIEGPGDRERIQVALDTFWTARAREAPTAAQLDAIVAEEARFVEALARDRGDPP